MGCREGLCPFSGQWVLVETYYWVVLDKNLKNPVSVFRVFDLLYIHTKPYESELSTALSECKAVTRSATRKTNTAINRIKTVGACKLWTLLGK